MKKFPASFLMVARDLLAGVFVSPDAKPASAGSVLLDSISLPLVKAVEASVHGTFGVLGQSGDGARPFIEMMGQGAECASAVAGKVFKARVASSEVVLSAAGDAIALLLHKVGRDALTSLRVCISEVSVTFAGHPDEKHFAHRIETGTVASRFVWMTQTGSARALVTLAQGRA